MTPTNTNNQKDEQMTKDEQGSWLSGDRSAPVELQQVYLYLLEGTASGYDTYNSCVVTAFSEEDAKLIHPNNHHIWTSENEWDMFDRSAWAASPSDVTAECLGVANADQINNNVICKDFHAG